jgi:antitoxin component YwqK of YwqJK toxin-antitoxin module
MEWLKHLAIYNNSKGILVNDLEEGLHCDRNTNGTIYTTVYSNGVLNGYQCGWFPNGQIMLKIKYKNDLLHGRYRTWYRNGNLNIDSCYIDNTKHGKHIIYHFDGTIVETQTYHYGKKKKE